MGGENSSVFLSAVCSQALRIMFFSGVFWPHLNKLANMAKEKNFSKHNEKLMI